jgi:glycosyltransferase involved in cell wall biosynthesis
MRKAADRTERLDDESRWMTLNIDLTDVAAHAVFHDDLTGIQRVQIEYAGALMRLSAGRTNVFSNVSDLCHDLRPLLSTDGRTISDIFAEIRRLYRLPVPIPLRPLLKRKLARPDRPAVGAGFPRLGHGDTLFVGGAFWAHAPSIGEYERAAEAGCEVVVMFHDFIPLTFPGLAHRRVLPAFRRMLRLPTRAIAISEHTKAQLEEARREIGVPAHLPPATVVPLAHEFSAAPRNQAPAAPPTVRTAMVDRIGAFVLCVGTIEIRKNHGPLLKLWEQLAREGGADWPKLVVAGKAGWRAGEALRALRHADRDAPYLWVEGPSDEELAWLYGRAAFTVFPSLAEGWGLPIGESLWFGKPCVASNATSMPEVGGPLCLYGDPRDIDTFAEPILRLARDSEFHARSIAAIKASPLRSWSQAASEIVAAVAGSSRETQRSRPRGGPAPPGRASPHPRISEREEIGP